MENAQGVRYVIAMVGLPARGTTYTARKLAGHLSWLGHATRVFNVGERRRSAVGARQPLDFFDPENPEAEETRAAIAMEVLDERIAWLSGLGEVAIFDATNTTRERRASIHERCEGKGFHVLFVEIIEDDTEVIEANVRETKLSSPDYADVAPNEAVRDFRRRIDLYDRVYEPLEDDEGPYLKLIERGRKQIMNRIEGYLCPHVDVPLHTVIQLTPRAYGVEEERVPLPPWRER